jgi:hypothetical protein
MGVPPPPHPTPRGTKLSCVSPDAVPVNKTTLACTLPCSQLWRTPLPPPPPAPVLSHASHALPWVQVHNGRLQCTHTVRLWCEATRQLVASVDIDDSCPRDALGYAYAPLASPVPLEQGKRYHLTSMVRRGVAWPQEKMGRGGIVTWPTAWGWGGCAGEH